MCISGEIILPLISITLNKIFKKIVKSEKCFDFDYYKKIVGFIMAYSFRDPNEDVIFLKFLKSRNQIISLKI